MLGIFCLVVGAVSSNLCVTSSRTGPFNSVVELLSCWRLLNFIRICWALWKWFITSASSSTMLMVGPKVPLWTNKKFLAQKYLYEQMHSKQKQKGSLFIQSSYETIIRARKNPRNYMRICLCSPVVYLRFGAVPKWDLVWFLLPSSRNTYLSLDGPDTALSWPVK